VNNLIDNAVKFTPQDGFVVLSLAEGNKEARLSVSDSGIGVPEYEHERIFRRFYRVDKARDSEHPGTGLGLHICRRIVEARDGTIEVESNVSGGATFTVRLPVAE
jgi:two-component system phosphate regulon sensor histidine kinase PhoR